VKEFRSRQLFIDLDGVLADFDGYYLECFGVDLKPIRANKLPDPDGFWQKIDDHGAFFRNLPLMPDARELWDGAHQLHPAPIILTGVPRNPYAADQKRSWVFEHLGPLARVICCESQHKRDHAAPGDVLIDDWAKYQGLWEEMGGIFILHTSAADSLARAAEHFVSS
jgi:5'(3')-deoxyribonucleotidase